MTIHVMLSRITSSAETLAGYDLTKTHLVAYHDGRFIPSGPNDDMGFYYFVPKIAGVFHVGVHDAFTILFLAILSLSVLCGLVGAMIYLRSKFCKLLALFYLAALSGLALMTGGIYIVYLSAVITVSLIFLCFIRADKLGISFFVFTFLSFLYLSVLHSIRANSGMGAILFMAIIVLLHKAGLKKKAVFAIVAIVGFAIPALFFNSLVGKRDAYLTNIDPTYVAPAKSHIFWHSVYMGLGFLNNDYGLKYLDEVGFSRAKEFDPDIHVLSLEYEKFMKRETISFIKENKVFTLLTVSSKAGCMLFYLLVFANAGLLLAFKYPKPFKIELAFWVALVFYSLFGILIVPYFKYALGFMAMGAVYGLVSVDHAIEAGLWKDILSKCRCIVSGVKETEAS